MRGSAPAFEEVDDDVERLFEQVDSLTRRRERDAERVVLGLRPSGAEPELETTVGQKVDRRGLPSEQPRMVQRVVDHQGAEPQRRRDVSRAHERAERIDDAEVVSRLQRAVAECLGLACEVLPFGPGAARKRLQREPERPHGAFSPASMATSSRLPGGASGQLHLGSKAHEGEYAKLKSTMSAPPRSAPFTVSST